MSVMKRVGHAVVKSASSRSAPFLFYRALRLGLDKFQGVKAQVREAHFLLDLEFSWGEGAGRRLFDLSALLNLTNGRGC